LAPGDGALPLSELLDALPSDVSLSVEMPMSGLRTSERLALAYAATVRTLASVLGKERSISPLAFAARGFD
jgi:hypothetical protein